MAHIFIVENGTGVAGANTYMDTPAADDYHDNIGTPDAAWANLTVAVKQQALRDATRYLDAKYNRRWKGVRSAGTNVLDWPRSGALDTDGYVILSTAIPQALLDATAEAALRALDTVQNPTGLSPDITSEGTITRKREKFDVFEEETEYAGGVDPYVTFTVIDRLLRDLIVSESSTLAGRA